MLPCGDILTSKEILNASLVLAVSTMPCQGISTGSNPVRRAAELLRVVGVRPVQVWRGKLHGPIFYR